jgi:hypothetical protein
VLPLSSVSSESSLAIATPFATPEL